MSSSIGVERGYLRPVDHTAWQSGNRFSHYTQDAPTVSGHGPIFPRDLPIES